MAKMPSSSVAPMVIRARPSPPTVTDLPVHWPLIKLPDITSQYVPAGRQVCGKLKEIKRSLETNKEIIVIYKNKT